MRRTNVHRTIYEQHYGTIPVDEEGRTYDVHHKDGNKRNNNPTNLIALSIEEHYKLHLKQGDIGACKALSIRMNLSPEVKTDLARKQHNEDTTYLFQQS